jgi:outer membrane lipoprotein-sorting protein
VFALSVFAVSASAQSLTADQIVEKHIAAIGGRDALAKLTSRKATGTITLATPAGDLNGPLEMIAKAPTKMHVSIKVDLSALGAAGEMQIEQMFDGTTGWMKNSMQGDAPMDGDQLEGARNAYFPTPLLNYKEHGVTLALQPQEKVGGRDAYVLLVTPKSGPPARMYFDAETFLLTRAVTKINSAQLGNVEQVSEASDYRTVDGVKVAYVIHQSAGGQDVTMKFDKIENNVPVDDAIFIKK